MYCCCKSCDKIYGIFCRSSVKHKEAAQVSKYIIQDVYITHEFSRLHFTLKNNPKTNKEQNPEETQESSI